MSNFLGLSDDREWKTFVFRWLGLSLIFHAITAIFSVGHHSADEYFQILEFLSYRLGNTPAHHLPTEFREQMRPWLQPALYWGITRVWQFFGVYNPFTWATSFRLFSGLIGWLSVSSMALCSRFWFPDVRARRFAVISLALIWYFPVLHVRPSSENLAGSTFLIALCLADLLVRRHKEGTSGILWLCVGVLLGFSFEFRFQMGFMIAGIFAWLIVFGTFKNRISVRSLGLMILGAGTTFLLGRWIDFWGYGQWVMSPLNYYNFNLVRGEISKYGTQPWWDVFRMSMTETWPFLGLLVAIGTAIAWIRCPRHILTWSQIPFFIVHEMISHKELRFFFPIALAGPILVTLALFGNESPKTKLDLTFEKFIQNKPFSSLARAVGSMTRPIFAVILLNNCVALVALLFMPFARTVQFYEGVYRQVPPHTKKFELYTLDRDPYILLGNPVFFYRPPELTVEKINSYSDLKTAILARKDPIWFFDDHLHLPPESEPISPYCSAVFQIFRPEFEKVNWGHWLERTLTWSLYRCQS